MEKQFIILLALFAWRVCAQTTGTDVSGGEELQTGASSPTVPASSAPEITSLLSDPEVIESETSSAPPSSVTEVFSSGESEATEPPANSAVENEVDTTESQEAASTQPSSEETTLVQDSENTESGIGGEDTNSEGTQQQQESDASDGTITTQPPVVISQEVITQDIGMSSQATSEQEDVTLVATQVNQGSESSEGPETTLSSTEDPTRTGLTNSLNDEEQENQSPEGTEPVGTAVEGEGGGQENQSPEGQGTEPVGTAVEVGGGQENQSPEGQGTEPVGTAVEGQQSQSPEGTEPVRSAVEGETVTVMVEMEESTSKPSTEEKETKTEVSSAKPESVAVNKTECPTNCLSGIGDPICGSDQRVYESECHLKKDTCRKNITVASWELCRGKHDICPAQCLNIQDPVCGEDGKIYPNLCLMFKFNCGKRMRTYDLVRCVNTFRGFRRVDGACPKVCHELYRPVCGSDGKVYSNDCYLRLQNCGRNVQIVEMSQCVDTPRCPYTCTPLYDPVCGSDRRMYLNPCYFANLNCGKNVAKVDIRHCQRHQRVR